MSRGGAVIDLTSPPKQNKRQEPELIPEFFEIEEDFAPQPLTRRTFHRNGMLLPFRPFLV